MKKILLITCLLLSLSSNAQKKYNQYNDNSGLVLASTGLLSITIGLLVPDGSEWTYKSYYDTKKTYKPFYMNPARDCMMVFGLSLTIGGLRYNHINNKR